MDSNHPPKYWPEISDSTKANIAKNIDKNISADSIIAVFDTTLFGNSCKNGIVFTVLGLYNIESFSRPEYANYSNIKSVELTEKKVNIHLKKGTIITNYNGTIKNRAALCDLLKELVHYNSIINESLNNDVHIILPDGTEEWFDTNGKTQDKTRKVSHWYDSMGNVIRALRPDGTDYNYRKDADGTEHWFDEKGEEFHRINSDGKELWFSKKSNSPIHTKEPDGVENWFDEQGINTYRKKPDGYEYWFDEQGEKSIRAKGPDGTEYWYDENENMTHQKDADGTEHWFENGQEIRRKNKFGTVYWFDGTSGKTIRAKYPDGSEEWYDSKGNIIRKKTSDGKEESYAYIESRPKSSSGEYDEQKAQDMAARYGRNATDEDINNVKNNMGKMNKGPLAKIWDKVMTLWAGFNSPNTPVSLKAMIIGGLIYMVSPVDLIPDFIPFLGLTDDAGVIGLVFSQFVRLTAGAAIVAGAAIKMYRIGVEEIKRKLNELNKKYSSIIVKNLKEVEDKYEVNVGLLDEEGNETEELTLEAPELAPDIRPGMTIHA